MFETIEYEYKPPAQRTVCADGVSLSIQGSAFTYCLPRNNAGPYSHMEVGLIENEAGEAISPPETWAEYADGDFPNDVYGYVPVELIEAFIADHGGRKQSGGL